MAGFALITRASTELGREQGLMFAASLLLPQDSTRVAPRSRESRFARERCLPVLRKLSSAVAIVSAPALLGLAFDRGLIQLNHPARAEFPIRGIDVSWHQGTVDWELVAESGEAEFAYVKATEGGDWIDPRFEENWAEARSHGVPTGAYHFFTLCRPGEEQAAHFIATVPVELDALPPVADLELGGNCARRPTRQELHRDLETWIEMVRAHFGREPVLYMTREMYSLYFRGSSHARRVWIRDVFQEPEQRDPEWLFWQFANRGSIHGVRGAVDINVYCCDRSSWARFLRDG